MVHQNTPERNANTSALARHLQHDAGEIAKVHAESERARRNHRYMIGQVALSEARRAARANREPSPDAQALALLEVLAHRPDLARLLRAVLDGKGGGR